MSRRAPLRVFGAFYLGALLIGCAQRQTQPVAVDPHQNPTSWRLDYSDGSGNHFTFIQPAKASEIHFTYDPVTPQESSSGRYSGGEAQTGILTADQATELRRKTAQLIADTTQHTRMRSMGTGTLRRTTSEEDHAIIIRRCPALKDFEAFLSVFGGG